MPRTVDHIVACHKAAANRREAGRPIWDKTIPLKDILHEDNQNITAEYVTDISIRMAAVIRNRLPGTFFDAAGDDYDPDFVDAIESMEECNVAALILDEKNGFEPVVMLNGWLETVYDWADRNRIWIG